MAERIFVEALDCLGPVDVFHPGLKLWDLWTCSNETDGGFTWGSGTL